MRVMASLFKVVAEILLQLFCLDFYAVDLLHSFFELLFHGSNQTRILWVHVESEATPGNRINLFLDLMLLMDWVNFSIYKNS